MFRGPLRGPNGGCRSELSLSQAEAASLRTRLGAAEEAQAETHARLELAVGRLSQIDWPLDEVALEAEIKELKNENSRLASEMERSKAEHKREIHELTMHNEALSIAASMASNQLLPPACQSTADEDTESSISSWLVGSISPKRQSPRGATPQHSSGCLLEISHEELKDASGHDTITMAVVMKELEESRATTERLQAQLEGERRAREEQATAAAAAAAGGNEDEAEAKEAASLELQEASWRALDCSIELATLVESIRVQLEVEGSGAIDVLVETADPRILSAEERHLSEALSQGGGIATEAHVPAAAVVDLTNWMSKKLRCLREIITDHALQEMDDRVDNCMIQ